MNLKVYIDNREQKRIKSATQYYTEQGLEVEVKELEIGDYIFTDGENSVCFEYKEINDFITSINDGRVFNQAINMAENYDYHFVVIRGTESERAKYLAISKNYRSVSIRKDKNPSLNFLCYCIYGLNYKRAKLIVDTYNLYSLEDLKTLTIDKLKEIDGIGENTARKIMEAIQ